MRGLRCDVDVLAKMVPQKRDDLAFEGATAALSVNDDAVAQRGRKANGPSDRCLGGCLRCAPHNQKDTTTVAFRLVTEERGVDCADFRVYRRNRREVIPTITPPP